jgi:hypothetical protein
MRNHGTNILEPRHWKAAAPATVRPLQGVRPSAGYDGKIPASATKSPRRGISWAGDDAPDMAGRRGGAGGTRWRRSCSPIRRRSIRRCCSACSAVAGCSPGIGYRWAVLGVLLLPPQVFGTISAVAFWRSWRVARLGRTGAVAIGEVVRIRPTLWKSYHGAPLAMRYHPARPERNTLCNVRAARAKSFFFVPWFLHGPPSLDLRQAARPSDQRNGDMGISRGPRPAPISALGGGEKNRVPLGHGARKYHAAGETSFRARGRGRRRGTGPVSSRGRAPSCRRRSLAARRTTAPGRGGPASSPGRSPGAAPPARRAGAK